MTEQELREKIGYVILATYHAGGEHVSISEIKEIGTARILTLIKEAGYVRLAEDQSASPIPRKDIVHIIMERDTVLRNAGWRKVEL